MKEAYKASNLPLKDGIINPTIFMEELIDATSKLEVYKEKIKDSKLDSSWFMPTLQQKEALASATLEGTQATLDGVLINQVTKNDEDVNVNEVIISMMLLMDILLLIFFIPSLFRSCPTRLDIHVERIRREPILGA